MINVLWIDDKPTDDFVRVARREGLVVIPMKNVDDGINELLTSNTDYDAVILDANCIKHSDDENDGADISALAYALKEMTASDISLPWFVYTTEGHEDEASIDVLVSAFEREYDDVNWYRKPDDMLQLFRKINKVVPHAGNYMLKEQFADVVDAYANQDELVDILEFLDESKKYDPSVFNMIRKQMEYIFEECYRCGILLQPYSELGLTAASKFMCQYQMEEVVPYHIQQIIRSVTRICNEGSHLLKIDSEVDGGRAPYLVRSTVYDFLNLVYWVNEELPKSPLDAEKMREKVAYAFRNNGYRRYKK